MTTVVLPCDSCCDAVTAHADYLTPVTLCGCCTPENWDGASLPPGAVDWKAIGPMPDWVDALLASPLALDDDGLLAAFEVEAAAVEALTEDDSRDEWGELREEAA